MFKPERTSQEAQRNKHNATRTTHNASRKSHNAQLTQRHPGRGSLPVDPEGHPRDDNNKVTGQVDLEQVVADLTLQEELTMQDVPETCKAVTTEERHGAGCWSQSMLWRSIAVGTALGRGESGSEYL